VVEAGEGGYPETEVEVQAWYVLKEDWEVVHANGKSFR
jgi:hypothetical protein